MGELIEMTTWPKHKFIFYPVTSNAFTLEVKGSGNAIIGLTSCLKKKTDFFILLNCDSYTCITRKENPDDINIRQRTPNLLSPNEYRRFWITWFGGWLAFGRQGETTPIVSVADASTSNLKYITFGAYHDRNCVHWKFNLAPLYKQPALKPLSEGKLHWVQGGNQLPDGALIGGYEDEFLYIIRAPHRGSLTPGKFVPSLGLGFISWGGSSHEKSEFEVLCGYDCTWVPSSKDRIPVDAIEAGYSEDRMERLYVGRAKHMGHLVPGKVQLSHKVCYIAFGEREIAATEYEVLACPNADTCAMSRFFSPSIDQWRDIPDFDNGGEYDEEEYDDYYEVDEDDDE